MRQVLIYADPEELTAWMRGTPIAAPQPPPPNRPTKTFIITVPTRDVIVLPAALFSNVRSEP